MNVFETKISDSVIYLFVRIFNKKEYAQSFVEGKIRFGKVSTYKQHEDANGEMRGDPHEGVISWNQPDNIKIKIGSHELSSDDIASPITVSSNSILDNYACCLYAIHSGDFDAISTENMEEFRKSLLINDEASRLGGHCVVITKPKEFQKRVVKYFEDNRICGRMAMVNYFDGKEHASNLPNTHHGMHKLKDFEHQNEYRILAEISEGEDYKTLDIGSISDICFITTPEEFNRSLALKLPDDNAPA